jgi:hypothetical protein
MYFIIFKEIGILSYLKKYTFYHIKRNGYFIIFKEIGILEGGI